MVICVVLPGKDITTSDDWDEYISSCGSISKAFDGRTAIEGGGAGLDQHNGWFITRRVAFGFFYEGQEVCLVVVDRQNDDCNFRFTADSKKLVFKYSVVQGFDFAHKVNRIRMGIKLLPKQEVVAGEALRRNVQSEIDTFRNDIGYSIQRVRANGQMYFAAQCALVFVVACVLLYLGSAVVSDMRASVRDVNKETISVLRGLNDRTGKLENTTGVLVEAVSNQGKAIGTLQGSHDLLQWEVNKHAREIDVLKDRVDAITVTQQHQQRAIEGPPVTPASSGVAPFVPRKDSIFDWLWSIIEGSVYSIGAMAFLLFGFVVLVMCCATVGDVTDPKAKRIKRG
jgi:hypothetical protein